MTCAAPGGANDRAAAPERDPRPLDPCDQLRVGSARPRVGDADDLDPGVVQGEGRLEAAVGRRRDHRRPCRARTPYSAASRCGAGAEHHPGQVVALEHQRLLDRAGGGDVAVGANLMQGAPAPRPGRSRRSSPAPRPAPAPRPRPRRRGDRARGPRSASIADQLRSRRAPGRRRRAPRRLPARRRAARRSSRRRRRRSRARRRGGGGTRCATRARPGGGRACPGRRRCEAPSRRAARAGAAG